VSPKAIAVAGLIAIAIAASGCSGDSDPEAEFRAAFEKEFSAAPWYHHITGNGSRPRERMGRGKRMERDERGGLPGGLRGRDRQRGNRWG